MTSHVKLSPSVPWVELAVDQSDWDAAEPQLLTSMFSQIALIRTFEEYVLELAGKGLVHGPAHSSIGQEGGAVGSILPLKDADYINGSHRGHHQFLAKALNFVSPGGIDLRQPMTDEVETVLLRTLAEICGLSRGYCRGRGGSMHLQWREAGAMGTNAIVGGGVPQALGFAHAMKEAGTDNVSVTCFGDGASNIGSVLESFNLAAAWRLPVLFFVENNHYAVSTRVDEVAAETRLSGRGPGFGIPSWRTDGMDTLAVYQTTLEALEYIRSGQGAALVEIDTYRFFHQNGPFPGSAFGYRTKDEEAQWRARDPLTQVADHLVRREIMSQADVDDILAQARDRMTRLGSVLLEPVPDGKPGALQIRAEEWPSPSFVDVGVRGDLSERDGLEYTEQSDFAGELGERKFIEIVAGVMERRMDTDDRIIVMGEDVQHLNGGTNGATRGLTKNHASRVLGTPISENAFAGFGLGLALDGRYIPVVEFMYPDFMWVAADQVFNQIAKARHMFGGEANVPLVLRSKVAMGTGYGSQHSMDPAHLRHLPGLADRGPDDPV